MYLPVCSVVCSLSFPVGYFMKLVLMEFRAVLIEYHRLTMSVNVFVCLLYLSAMSKYSCILHKWVISLRRGAGRTAHLGCFFSTSCSLN